MSKICQTIGWGTLSMNKDYELIITSRSTTNTEEADIYIFLFSRNAADVLALPVVRVIIVVPTAPQKMAEL